MGNKNWTGLSTNSVLHQHISIVVFQVPKSNRSSLLVQQTYCRVTYISLKEKAIYAHPKPQMRYFYDIAHVNESEWDMFSCASKSYTK